MLSYPSWARGITKALNAKGKLAFVDGSLPPPKDPAKKACWKRCDDLMVSWITNSCEPDIRSSCLYANSAFTIWKDLHVRFSQVNAPKLFQLKTAISNLKQDEKSVIVYYTQLKILWDELDSLNPPETCICGASKFLLEQHARDRAMEFLQGLHDKFAPIRSQILFLEPIPTAERMFNLVKQEEMQEIINNSIAPLVESVDLQVYGNSQHFRSSTKRQRPFCDHCHGHTKEHCYRLHGFSDHFSPHQAHNGKPHVAAATVQPVPAPPTHHVQPVTVAHTPTFTAEQYNHILALLNTLDNEDDASARVNLADNGSGFLSRDFYSWIFANGIHHQRICVSNPQQNGVVERKHRHLLNVARALRFQSNKPLKYWGEFLLTAAYLINKIPTLTLHNKSPHEILMGTPPDYTKLCVFGCLCYARNTHVLHKFDARAQSGIFIGYPFNHKGYKILDIKTKKIFISHNVIFHEDLFPFKDALPVQTDFLLTHESSESLYDFSEDSPIQSSNPPISSCSVSPQISSSNLPLSKFHYGSDFSNIGNSPGPPSPAIESSSSSPSPSPSSSSSLSPEVSPPLARHVRTHRAPRWMDDYQCKLNLCTSSSPHPLTTSIPFHQVPPSQQKILASIINVDEPRTFTEAIKSPDWREAMATQIKALESTWTVTTLPPGKKAVGCRGYGGFGALGDSVYIRELIPRLVEGPWDKPICHVSTSGTHTAAITESVQFKVSCSVYTLVNHFVKSKTQVDEWQLANKRTDNMQRTGEPCTMTTDRWKRREVDQLKLNVDASVVEGQNSFVVGMVLRNNQAQYIAGKTMRFAGVVPILEAELACIWEAVIIESDSLLSVNVINQGHDNVLESGDLVQQCQKMIRSTVRILVSHIKK
ncbi:uncharacterized protein LOC141718263 [Apium graveolens]|uniref:uncharacterized protein LOC141718263 n=1 Tax=Apium graveolens TaxID=4045 RepID=UPI003D7BF4B9